MVEYCPIVNERVDTKLIRINAFFVLSALLFFFFTPLKWLIYIVAIDFVIRVFFGVKHSPVCKIIRKSLDIISVEQHKVNAGPKKVAAKFGLAFSILIIISELLGWQILSSGITIFFILATALEVFFSFCLVCKIYPYLNKVGIK